MRCKGVDDYGSDAGGKAELAAYQLKGVAQIWFNQWKEGWEINASPLD